MKKFCKILFFSFIFLISFSVLVAEEASFADSVIKKIENSSINKIEETVINALPKTSANVEKYKLCTFLANCYEESSNFNKALEYYKKAYDFPTNKKNDTQLSIVRVNLQLGNYDEASSTIEKILLTSTKEEELNLARYYSAIVLLQKSKFQEAEELLKLYSQTFTKGQAHRKVLFTLWYIDDDEEAKTALLEQYPHATETLLVSQKISLLAKPFWIFLPRKTAEELDSSVVQETSIKEESEETAIATALDNTEEKNSPRNTEERVSTRSTKYSDIKFQQVGFFKTKEYAEVLVKELQEKGFLAEIRKSERANGTVYFAVIVPENPEGSTGKKLKTQGYEFAPLFE